MKILGCSWKEAAGCTGAILGILLAGAEGPDFGIQVLVNLGGLGLFILCVLPVIGKEMHP